MGLEAKERANTLLGELRRRRPGRVSHRLAGAGPGNS
jgi:hypothetical protein